MCGQLFMNTFCFFSLSLPFYFCVREGDRECEGIEKKRTKRSKNLRKREKKLQQEESLESSAAHAGAGAGAHPAEIRAAPHASWQGSLKPDSLNAAGSKWLDWLLASSRVFMGRMLELGGRQVIQNQALWGDRGVVVTSLLVQTPTRLSCFVSILLTIYVISYASFFFEPWKLLLVCKFWQKF